MQATILRLFEDLRSRLGLTVVFISHNLAVVRHLSDSVAVMYLGRIVEQGDRESVFGDPRHPYTRALLAAAPRLHQIELVRPHGQRRTTEPDRHPDGLLVPSPLPALPRKRASTTDRARAGRHRRRAHSAACHFRDETSPRALETVVTNPLLDPLPIPPARFERLERAVASLLQTRLDVVLPQAEAVLPLEAAARGLGRVGATALNLNTIPYGATIGHWLGQAGATVIGIGAEPRKAVAPEMVERALRINPEISMVSFVHVEAASGVRNDAPAITALAREHGAMVLIDVVASTGAHEVRLDDWGADVAVIGPQKALAGPAGISIAAVSGRAWRAMSDNPGAAPRLGALAARLERAMGRLGQAPPFPERRRHSRSSLSKPRSSASWPRA